MFLAKITSLKKLNRYETSFFDAAHLMIFFQIFSLKHGKEKQFFEFEVISRETKK